MIYECPSCHTPQAAGQTSCHQCGADFEGPVPDDAVVPEPTAAAAVPEAGQNTPPGQPPAEQVGLPPAETPPFQVPPPALPAYQPPPPYTAPPAYQAAPPPSKLGGGLPKGVLIGIPIVLVLVLGAVLFTRNLDQGSDTVVKPPAATAPAPALPAVPAPAPVGPPVTLSGGTASTSTGSNAAKFLVGRWQTKSTDFFVFNDNGTGSRGSITGKQSKAVFVWVLAQNQLILYSDKQEKLAFSPGSDDDSMFLRGEDGRYVEYRRTKTNA